MLGRYSWREGAKLWPIVHVKSTIQRVRKLARRHKRISVSSACKESVKSAMLYTNTDLNVMRDKAILDACGVGVFIDGGKSQTPWSLHQRQVTSFVCVHINVVCTPV